MRLGFIGLGAMGRHMASNLQRAGHEVQAHDLRRVEGFPNWKTSAAEAARGCEVLFTSLPGPKEVEDLSKEISSNLKEGAAWFDLSTNSPEMVRRLHRELPRIRFLDAPVSGGPSGARSGKLALWVGGDKDVFLQHKKVLDSIGDQAVHVGPIGAGSVTKLVHNCAGYAIQTALAEVFTMGVKAGVEPLALWEAVRQGALGRQRTFDRMPHQFFRGKYDPPNFALRLAHKDVSLATALGRELNVPMRVANLALAELTEALNRGWGERDSRIPMSLQEERAGVQVRVEESRLKAALDREGLVN